MENSIKIVKFWNIQWFRRVFLASFVILLCLFIATEPRMSLMLLGFIILLLLLFLYTEIGLLLFIALMPLHAVFVNKFGVPGAWKELILMLIFIVWLIRGMVKNNVSFTKTRVNILIITFAFYCSVLLLVNINEFNANILGLRNLLEYSLVFFLSINIIKRKESLKKYFIVILSFGLLIAVVNLIAFLFNPGKIEGIMYGAYHSSTKFLAYDFLGANNYPVYLSFLFCFILGLFLFNRSKKMKLLLSFGMIILIVSILSTYSRGTIFALVVALVYCGVKYCKKILFILLAICLLGALFVPTSFRQRFFTSESYEEAITSRFDIILENSPSTYDNLFFGIGLSKVGSTRGNDAVYPHNYYMYLLLQTGICGLGIYLLMFFVFFKTSLKLVNHFNDIFFKGIAVGIVMFYVVYAVSSLFIATGEAFLSAFLFWFIGGVVMILDNDICRKKALERGIC